MRRHLLRQLELASVLQIRCDACSPEGVAAYGGIDTGRQSTALDHGVGICLRYRITGKPLCTASDRLEKRRARRFFQACGVNVIVKVGFKRMVAGEFYLCWFSRGTEPVGGLISIEN